MGINWVDKGYWHIKGKDCFIWTSTRPHYCDRGNYLAHLETSSHFSLDIDEADLWPRYYFDFNIMQSEIEAWLKTRNQYIDSNWINNDGHGLQNVS